MIPPRSRNGPHYHLHPHFRPAPFRLPRKCHQCQCPGWHNPPPTSPEDYRKDRVDKYAQYLKGNRILPIPELVEAVQPNNLSFIITDIKTRRLAGIKKKNTFEEWLKTERILAKCFCRCSFATWDVQPPSEEQAVKLAGGNINSKFFLVQPEYLGRRQIKVTACNVQMQINGKVFAAFLSEYGEVEDVSKAKSTNGTAHGDYLLTMCLNRGVFQAIPHTLEYKEQIMMVVVEGRRLQC